MPRPLAPALGACLLWAHVAGATEDVGAYARELSALRTEVEQLSETLELEREALRSELRAAELRRAELEARIRQEELKLQGITREVARQREVIDADDLSREALTPMLLEALDGLKAQVEAGLPYRQSERLAALDQLADQLQEATLDPRRGVGRVWTFVEDELRLTRENILDRQVIDLGGEEVLVDVARLGMIAMFFRTEDGRFGRAERAGTDWTWTVLSDAGDTARLEELFDALEKQVRVGWFELPWALPEVAR